MAQIRFFQNSDLPELARVWIEHWSAVGQAPPVSTAIVEQALLSRTFFDPRTLLVAAADAEPSKTIYGWSHYFVNEDDRKNALLSAICFSPEGLDCCDQLLGETESRAKSEGIERFIVGCRRNIDSGYVGFPPLGHGIGVASNDTRVSSLLSRHGYVLGDSIARLVATTNPFRMPVSREALKLRRSTRLEVETLIPTDPHRASAMSHMDIQRHWLTNHLTGDRLASLELWLSDPEAQVMDCSQAILHLDGIHERGEATTEELYLIGAVVQSLANQRIFSAETAIDSEKPRLLEQLTELGFRSVEQGHAWTKSLDASQST